MWSRGVRRGAEELGHLGSLSSSWELKRVRDRVEAREKSVGFVGLEVLLSSNCFSVLVVEECRSILD